MVCTESYIIHTVRSDLPPGHGVPDLQSERLAHGRRHGVPNLPVLVQGGAVELVGVGESLTAGTFSDGHQPDMVTSVRAHIERCIKSHLF